LEPIDRYAGTPMKTARLALFSKSKIDFLFGFIFVFGNNPMLIIDILCVVEGQGGKILLLARAQKDFLGIPGRFLLYTKGAFFLQSIIGMLYLTNHCTN